MTCGPANKQVAIWQIPASKHSLHPIALLTLQYFKAKNGRPANDQESATDGRRKSTDPGVKSLNTPVGCGETFTEPYEAHASCNYGRSLFETYAPITQQLLVK